MEDVDNSMAVMTPDSITPGMGFSNVEYQALSIEDQKLLRKMYDDYMSEEEIEAAFKGFKTGVKKDNQTEFVEAVSRGNATDAYLRTLPLVDRILSMGVPREDGFKMNLIDMKAFIDQIFRMVPDKAQLEKPIDPAVLFGTAPYKRLDADYSLADIKASFDSLSDMSSYTMSAAFGWQILNKCVGVDFDHGDLVIGSKNVFATAKCPITFLPLYVVQHVELARFLSGMTGKTVNVVPSSLFNYMLTGYVMMHFKLVNVGLDISAYPILQAQGTYKGIFNAAQLKSTMECVRKQFGKWAIDYNPRTVSAKNRRLEWVSIILQRAEEAGELLRPKIALEEALLAGWLKTQNEYLGALEKSSAFDIWCRSMDNESTVPRLTSRSVLEALEVRRKSQNKLGAPDYDNTTHNVCGNGVYLSDETHSTVNKFVNPLLWLKEMEPDITLPDAEVALIGIASGHFVTTVEHLLPDADYSLHDIKTASKKFTITSCDVTVSYPDAKYVIDDVQPDGEVERLMSAKLVNLAAKCYKGGIVKLGMFPNDDVMKRYPLGMDCILACYSKWKFFSSGRLHNAEYYLAFSGYHPPAPLAPRDKAVVARFFHAKRLLMHLANDWRSYSFIAGYIAPFNPLSAIRLTTHPVARQRVLDALVLTGFECRGFVKHMEILQVIGAKANADVDPDGGSVAVEIDYDDVDLAD